MPHKNPAAYVREYKKRHPLRGSWDGLKARCESPSHHQYFNYGGRGIKVKFKNFHEFEAYILMFLGPQPPGKTLDRINNDAHYERGNLRWASPKEQSANRRTTNGEFLKGYYLGIIFANSKWAEFLAPSDNSQ